MSAEERRRNRRGTGLRNREWTLPERKDDGVRRNRRGRVIGTADPRPTTQTSGNIIRFKGKEYTEEEFNKEFGSLRELALSEQEALGREGRGADIRGGGGYKEDGTRFTAPTVADIDGSDGGTQTSPNRNDKPTDWAGYESWLREKYTKEATGQQIGFYQDRNGQQSTALPVTSASETYSPEDDQVMGRTSLAEREAIGNGGFVETVIDGDDMKTTISAGAQSPISDSADKGDQSRALSIPKRPRGARAQEIYDRQYGRFNPGSDDDTPKGGGISRRSRAFLDAPMGEGPAALMRRTNASQGILRKDGKIAVKTGDGQYQEITQEGYNQIRQSNRNSGGADLGKDFLDRYKAGMQVADPKQTDSPDLQMPTPVSRETPAQAYQKDLNGTVTLQDPDIQTKFTLQGQDGREPLMRSGIQRDGSMYQL